MLTWVIYDISNDKIRKKISDLCLNKGLKRVQKSVFLGKINKNQREEIALFCKEKMNKEND